MTQSLREAVVRSESHDEIVTVTVEDVDSAAEELIGMAVTAELECDTVDANGVTEVYAYHADDSEDDMVWRVHLVSYTGKCHHCALTAAPDDCAPAAHEAHWVDAAGVVADKAVRVCGECLDAGDAAGPGYRPVVHTRPRDKADAAMRLADAVKALVESQTCHPVSSIYGPFRRDGGPETVQERAFTNALVTYSGFCR